MRSNPAINGRRAAAGDAAIRNQLPERLIDGNSAVGAPARDAMQPHLTRQTRKGNAQTDSLRSSPSSKDMASGTMEPKASRAILNVSRSRGSLRNCSTVSRPSASVKKYVLLNIPWKPGLSTRFTVLSKCSATSFLAHLTCFAVVSSSLRKSLSEVMEGIFENAFRQKLGSERILKHFYNELDNRYVAWL